MNNPLSFVQMMRNPQAFMQEAMSNSQIMSNPIAKNAFEMYQKGDIQGVNQLAENLCKEKGTSVEEMKRQIKTQIGM